MIDKQEYIVKCPKCGREVDRMLLNDKNSCILCQFDEIMDDIDSINVELAGAN